MHALKVIIIPLLLSILTNTLIAGNIDKTIRYDVCFTGKADHWDVIHSQTKIVQFATGNSGYEHQFAEKGNMRLVVKETETGDTLFIKGFSPLFQEWLLTSEANTKEREFYQALYFPHPSKDVLVSIDLRNIEGQWGQKYADTLFISDIRIKNENPKKYKIDTLLYSGHSQEKIDLVFLSEGYTREEMDKYVADAKRMARFLLNFQPFNEFQNKFNLYAIQVPSAESGADEPEIGILKNTAFNATWNTFESERYLTSGDMLQISNAADEVSWDQIVIIVNSARYGGGGFYNWLSIFSSDHQQSELVFIHEFGHAFAGLADEYYYNGDIEDTTYPITIEPWEPNITTLVQFDKKWKGSISHKTPLPTPRDSMYINTIGLFEGGGYRTKGIYSPSITCLMKTLSTKSFCPVCQEAIRQTILNQAK